MLLLTVVAMVCVALCSVGFAQEGPVLRIHVAPGGDDGNPGTEDQPLATLHAAQNAVRALIQEGLTQPVDVVLEAGTYALAKPLELTSEDSGTEECPITYRAADGAEVVISGGVPVTGWQQREDGLWAAPCPEVDGEPVDSRLMRVGDKWATRARYPNYDPENPYEGGWLFAGYGGKSWEKGAFGTTVSNIHNVNDKITWTIDVPADGSYLVWIFYGHHMTTYGVEDMGGKTAFSVDGGEQVPLMNLPDTGAWNAHKWAATCTLELTAGEHELVWTNLEGGGIDFDALALTDDDQWDPEKAITNLQWWGAYDLQQPPEGKHLLLIQAEACDKAEGPEVRVAKPEPPGVTTHIAFKDGDVPAFEDLTGAEAHIFIAWGWVNAIVPVESIDYEAQMIKFAGDGAAQDVRLGNRYFIENVREALDAPGEWFHDTQAGEILYIPEEEGFAGEDVTLAKLDRLIVVSGDAEAGAFVENVHFRGLRFADTDYSLTTAYYTPADTTILMDGARNCSVRDCEFSWLGGYALTLTGRSEGCSFRENRVHHMGHGGVLFTGGTAVQAHHCSVLGNTMEHLGLIWKHVAGVYVTHGSDNRIAHNRITDVPRYAISMKSQGEDRLSHRNVVEYNELIRTNLETNDTGAIETLGYEHRDSGNVIRYNLILDSVGLKTTPEGEIMSPYFSWGVYLDDYSSGTHVYGNIIARNTLGGGCIHGGRNNVFENNIMVGGTLHEFRLQPRDEYMQGNKFINNIVMYSTPEADLIYSYNDRKDVVAEWDRNVYWLIGADLETLDRKVTPLGTFADWRAAGFDENSVVADPLFVDAENDDYRLKPESPAFKLGFKPIPVEKIGPDGLEME